MAKKRMAKAKPDTLNPADLVALAANRELMEIGRRAVEDELIEWRDARMFTLRNNGLVVREKDGSESTVIRFGPEVGVQIALKAIAQHLTATKRSTK